MLLIPILEFRNVSLRIGDHWVLRNINLHIHEGETLVLLGRSGSGKTSLLRTVLALAKPTDGEVYFQGKATTDWNPVRLRRRLGYVLQDAGLFPHWTVGQNVGLVPRLENWDPAVTRSRVELLLSRMGMPPEQFIDRYPRSLSGGQRQRVGVARALAADPPVMLLDEPFGALDPVTRFDLQNQFRSLRDSFRKTSIFVTHDVREALALASRIALLAGGELDLVASPDAFRLAQTPEAAAFLACLKELPAS